MKNECLVCPAAWAAFERIPPEPEGGWPPQSDNVKIEISMPAWKCMSLSLLYDGERSLLDMGDGVARGYQVQKSDRSTVELFYSLRECY